MLDYVVDSIWVIGLGEVDVLEGVDLFCELVDVFLLFLFECVFELCDDFFVVVFWGCVGVDVWVVML